LPRSRWWLILACLALLVVGLLCWQRTSGRFTREQYDRIRLGMTPAEVALVMGGRGTGPVGTSVWDKALERIDSPAWDSVAEKSPAPMAIDRAEAWLDESAAVMVGYCDDKTIKKEMLTRVPLWKIKAREWLDWLRGLVGW
jgi:hypothetical protein